MVPNSQIDMVVRHGDVVARGHDVVSIRKEWRFEVEPEGGDFVVGQPAIATAVAIAK